MNSKEINISWELIWKLFFALLVGWLLYLASDVVAALLLAIVVSTAFHPAVSFLEKKRIPRIVGTLIIYLLAIFLLGLIIYTIIPIALSELTNLLESSGSFLKSLSAEAEVKALVEALRLNLARLTALLFSGNISLIQIASRFLGSALFAAAIFVLSFYLTLRRDGVERFLIAILPAAYEEKAIQIYARVSRKIGRWLTGQLFLSLVVGIVIFLGLWLLGVKYSLLIGILAGILELIPYAGPIFSGAIAILSALSESPALALYVLIFFAVVQQLENHILMPVVMRYTTALNPVVVLIALLIGGRVFGLIGIVLAVPIAVFFQELLIDWAETKQARRGMGL